MSDYNSAMAQQHGYLQPNTPITPDDRLLTNIRLTAERQAQVITRLMVDLSDKADDLFGPIPMPANAPIGTEVAKRAPPRVEGAAHAQYLVDEAIEGLRRQIERFDRL
jgi:hypothetical protein